MLSHLITENEADVDRRILIVDDEPYNLLGLKIILSEAAGDRDIENLVDTATNGLEALNMVKKAYAEEKFQYGLIFMDLSMPILDGYKAT